MTTAWEVASAACGVIYFAAWSGSFYPQIWLNYERKTTLGLSPDFVVVNPIGFACLAIWSFGAYFSTTARKQYQKRHDGHLPQVSKSDLAFSAHATFLALVTLAQSLWYYYQARKRRAQPTPDAESPLIAKDETHSAPTRPSLPTRIALGAMAVAAAYQVTALVFGRIELLDFLYFASTLKILITLTKYVPQMVLNYQLKSVRGFSIGGILCDLTGGVFSLLQLVISAVLIDHQPAGIIANPGKLGLSILTIVFDLIFVVQKYWLYPTTLDTED